MHHLKKKLLQLLKPGIAILLLFILGRSGLLKVEQLKASLQDSALVGWGCFILFVQIVFFSLRWKFFVNQHVPFGLLTALRHSSLGLFFNFFIPGGVGGDVVKAMDLSKSTGISKGTSISLIFLDRIFGLYAMIIFAFVFLTLEWLIAKTSNLNYYVLISAALFVISSVGILFAKTISKTLILFRSRFETDTFFSKLAQHTINLSEKIASGLKLRNLGWALVFSFFAQLFSILFLHYVCTRLAPDAMQNFSFFLFFPLACFGFMATAIPIAPGGIGLGQASFYLIFSNFNSVVANQLVIAISLLQLFNLLFGLVGGILYFRPIKSHT